MMEVYHDFRGKNGSHQWSKYTEKTIAFPFGLAASMALLQVSGFSVSVFRG